MLDMFTAKQCSRMDTGNDFSEIKIHTKEAGCLIWAKKFFHKMRRPLTIPSYIVYCLARASRENPIFLDSITASFDWIEIVETRFLVAWNNLESLNCSHHLVDAKEGHLATYHMHPETAQLLEGGQQRLFIEKAKSTLTEIGKAVVAKLQDPTFQSNVMAKLTAAQFLNRLNLVMVNPKYFWDSNFILETKPFIPTEFPPGQKDWYYRAPALQLESNETGKTNGTDTLEYAKATEQTSISEESSARVLTPSDKCSTTEKKQMANAVFKNQAIESPNSKPSASSSTAKQKAPPLLDVDGEAQMSRTNPQLAKQGTKRKRNPVVQSEEGDLAVHEKRRNMQQPNDREMQTFLKDPAWAKANNAVQGPSLANRQNKTIKELDENMDAKQKQEKLVVASERKIEVIDLLDEKEERKPSIASGEVRKLQEQIQSLREIIQLHKEEARMHSIIADHRQEQNRQMRKHSDDEKKHLKEQITAADVEMKLLKEQLARATRLTEQISDV